MKVLKALVTTFLNTHDTRTWTLEVPVRRGPSEPELDGNRRGSQRQGVPVSGWYKSGSAAYQRTHVVELSAGGARVVLDKTVKAGQTLDVTLRLEDGRFVSATSKVVWVQGLPGGVRQVAGLQLQSTPADRAALERLLR